MKTLVFEYNDRRFRAYLPESLVNKNSNIWNLKLPEDSAINNTRNNYVIKNIMWNAHHIERPTYGNLVNILIKGFNYKNAAMYHMAQAILEDLNKTNIFKEDVQYGTPLNPKNPRDREYIRRGIGYEEEIAPQRECWKKHGIKDPFEE